MKAPRPWDAIPVWRGSSYYEYLESDEWKMRRAAIRWRAQGRCERCTSARRPQNVHHLTYERLGRERATDLVLLCKGCHQAVHEIEPQKAGMTNIGEAMERVARRGAR